MVLTIISASIAFVVLFTPMYRWTIQILNIPEQIGMSLEQIMDNYYVLIRYLHNPFTDTITFIDFPTSASGAFHFYEVQILILINYAVLFVSCFVSVWYIKFVTQTKTWYRLIQPFFYLTFAPFVFFILLVLNFDHMFVVFHELLFNNDAWLFNPVTDPIIKVLPQEFFMVCFAVVFLLNVAAFFGIYVIAKRRSKFSKKPQS